MNTVMSKQRLVDEMSAVQLEWEALMQEVGEERMLESGATGWWSVRDVIAHLMSYSRWFVDAYDAHRRGEFIPMDGTEAMPFEEKNQTYYERTKDLSLHEVRSDARYYYQRLLDMDKSETEEFLTQPQVFKGAPESIIVWHPLRSEVYDHYRVHMKLIREWLNKDH